MQTPASFGEAERLLKSGTPDTRTAGFAAETKPQHSSSGRAGSSYRCCRGQEDPRGLLAAVRRVPLVLSR